MKYPILKTTTKKEREACVRALLKLGWSWDYGIEIGRAVREVRTYGWKDMWILGMASADDSQINVFRSYAEAVACGYLITRMNSLDHLRDYVKMNGLMPPPAQ